MNSLAWGLRRARTVAPSSPKTQGRLVYAIGDIHGRYDLLTRLLEQIVMDLNESQTSERPLLILLGDYIDRGPRSAEVLESVLWLQGRPEFEVRALKGNHEQAMLRFLEDPVAGAAWIEFGGDATLMSYRVRVPRPLDEEGLFRARDALSAELPQSHLELMRGLELSVIVGDYAFVHAGVRPGVPLDEQEENDLLWIRNDFLRAAGPFDKVIVHGHTWEPVAQIFDHRLGIDTGAYATGVLTAVRIDDDGHRLLQANARAAAA